LGSSVAVWLARVVVMFPVGVNVPGGALKLTEAVSVAVITTTMRRAILCRIPFRENCGEGAVRDIVDPPLMQELLRLTQGPVSGGNYALIHSVCQAGKMRR
jgi:hypothetical protein